MPSPIGHALGGVIFGVLAARWRATGGRTEGEEVEKGRVLLFATLGVAPDIDLLFGIHNAYTHSVGAALLVGLAVGLFGRRAGIRLASAAAASYGSHVLLDWLNDDSSPPIGIMALWPVTTEYYQSDLYLFMAIQRRYWVAGFLAQNVRAIAWEILLLGPFAMLVWWVACRGSRGRGRRSAVRD